MNLPGSAFSKKHYLKPLMLLTLGLAVFLTDNANLTSASSFDGGGRRNRNLRLPASAAKPIITFDCSKAKGKIEVSTPFEAIRLEGKNCSDGVVVENPKLKNKLVTFALDKKTYSSEYAYLARGENVFTVTSGKKKFQIHIIRM